MSRYDEARAAVAKAEDRNTELLRQLNERDAKVAMLTNRADQAEEENARLRMLGCYGRCKTCGGIWRRHADSWQHVAGTLMRPCCDNAKMDLEPFDLAAVRDERIRERDDEISTLKKIVKAGHIEEAVKREDRLYLDRRLNETKAVLGRAVAALREVIDGIECMCGMPLDACEGKCLRARVECILADARAAVDARRGA